MIMRELYKETLSELSKEDLITIIESYYHCKFMIGETLVSESKSNISSDRALDNIRGYLSNVDFKFYDKKKLKYQIELKRENKRIV